MYAYVHYMQFYFNITVNSLYFKVMSKLNAGVGFMIVLTIKLELSDLIVLSVNQVSISVKV